MNLKLWFIPVCMDLIDDLGLDDPTLCLAFDFDPDLAQPGLVKSGLSITSRNKSGLSNNLRFN